MRRRSVDEAPWRERRPPRPAALLLVAVLPASLLAFWTAAPLPASAQVAVAAGSVAAAPVALVPGAAGSGPAALRIEPGRAPPAAQPDRFRLPIPPPVVILTPFRPPPHRYGPGHRGVDLAGTATETVMAAGSGTVVFAGTLAGRGVVSIEHSSGLRTTYEPVTAAVSTGDRVIAGSTIGTLQIGHPACAPAICLHWGARLPDGSYLNPMSLINGLRVRLLPWGGRVG